MDPNENLQEQRQIIARMRRIVLKSDIDRLVELVESLDKWLSAEGFPPG